ncbi:MAG: LrgB family protein [Bacteroidales bacterium]|nr:LrgB family protein [Bacteroidales bacterium]
MIYDIISSVPFLISLTLGAYILGVWVRTKSKISMLNPMLIAIPIIISFLLLSDIPPQHYIQSNRLITFMLGPCVVALGLTLYDHRTMIATHAVSILTAVVVGSVVGVVSVVFMCRWLDMDEIFVSSMSAKSVTLPIALDVSHPLGGNAAITAVSVAVCGLFGGVCGPMILRWLGIRNPVAVGAAMGSASHGIGTARALEEGAVQGAVSGLCMGLMGVATAALAPLLMQWLSL